MATIVTRSGKGSPLTNNEVDANFTNLNTELGAKADTSSLATVATTGAYADLTGKPTNVSSFTNDVGYLTSSSAITETDPTVPSHVKAITTTKISNWDTSFSWGNHASAGYLTDITSGQVTTALGYTPYNATNPSGYLSTVSLTANVTGTLPITNGGTGATTASGARTALGLGTAATTDATAYATADQGAKADTAVQTIASTDGSVTITGTTDIDLSVAVAGSTSNVLLPVRNTTGATLTKGTAVYISGATGQLSTVSKAIATSDATSAQTLGLVTANIANNSNGNVTLIGTITNIDTSAYTDGQQLYLSPTTAGTLTSTKPYAPQHLVYMAVVEHAHPSQGKLFVKVQNGYEMDELHDVSAQSPSNNDGLFYNTTTSLWEKKSIVTALGYTPYDSANPTGYITSSALTPYLTSATAATTYQPLDGDLTAIAALAGTSGIVRKTAADTYTLDTATYLTGITSGQVTTALGFTPYDATNPAGYTTNTGTVTSVGGTGTVNGITLTGTVTESGSLTLGGTLSGVDLTSQITGTLGAANGGTGLTSSGAAGNVLTSNGSAWVSQPASGGGLAYTAVKTANYSTIASEGVQTDTSGGSFTVTLPASPAVGAQVFVIDTSGSWATNNLTVGRNGSTIEGSDEDLICNISNVSVQLVYSGTTWNVFAQAGGAAAAGAGAISVAGGGTGATTLASNNVLLGNGTSPIQTVAPSTAGNILVSDGTTWTSAAPASGGINYTTKTSAYTAEDKDGILANTSAGAFTVTLPASPETGSQVIIADAADTWGSNNLTIDRNGSTIEAAEENLVCDINGASMQLIYTGTTWQVYAQIGAASGSVLTAADIGVTVLGAADIGVTVQGYDADLHAIGALSGTSGLLQKTAANTWTLNTTAYAPVASPTFSGTVSDGLGKLRAIPQTGAAKTSSYTLTTADVGTFVNVGTGGSVTIPNSTFATGDAISIYNDTTGNITITCSITTAYIGGTNTDKNTMTLATRGVATILFISGTLCVVSGNVS